MKKQRRIWAHLLNNLFVPMVITIYFISKIIKIDRFFAYFSLPEGPEGLRLRKAFNHLVFIDDDDDVDILRSP